MIADIEFRWNNRIVRETTDYLSGEIVSTEREKVLQYRKKILLNPDELNKRYEMTDWQDMPVVEG